MDRDRERTWDRPGHGLTGRTIGQRRTISPWGRKKSVQLSTLHFVSAEMFCHGLISYVPNYFSIPDILATQEKVPCTFEVQVKHLGFLDPGSDKRDIEVGTNIELPFWMASVLKTQRPAIADVGLPKIFKESYRDILKADPVVVDLHKLAPYFYEFGMSLCMLNHRESPEIVNVLVESFKQRFRKILDWAQHSNIEVPESKKLDNAEKIIYQAGREVGSSLHLWLTEGGSLIMAAGMVMQHKKMKLTQRDLLQ